MKNFETVQDILKDAEELEEIKRIFDLHPNTDNILKISNKEGYHLPSFQEVVEHEVSKGGGRLHVISRSDLDSINAPAIVAEGMEKPVEVTPNTANEASETNEVTNRSINEATKKDKK